MKGTLTTILGSVVCLGALAAWTYTAPAAGSGWILFVAFLGILGFRNSIGQPGLATVAGVLLTAAAGAAWWFNRDLPHVGWVLFLTILCALRTFATLNRQVASDTGKESKKKTKKQKSES